MKDIEDEIPFEVPEGWAWCRLKELALDMADGPFGSNLKTEHYTTNKEARLIQLSNIGEDGWREENTKYTTFEHAKTYISRSIVEQGDIVIAKMMPAGRAIICPNHEAMYVLSSDAVKLVPTSFINKELLLNTINSPAFRNSVTDNVQGTTRLRTSISKLKECLFPLPPEKAQLKIVNETNRVIGIINELDEDKESLQTAIKRAKSKILDLAIHGKLVPQDSSDEPASVLLERLREEKEAKIAKGEIKRDKNDSYIYKSTTDNCHYQRFADGHEEDISEEIHCELPESWAWCRIKDICTINPKNKLDDNLEVSFIPMTLIDAGYTNHHGQETRVWKKIKTGFTHFAENDVAIAKISPCFENKKSVILKNLKNGYGAGTTELYILRACSIVLPEYLFWIVKTDSFINEGVGNFSGVVGQQRLARDIVENYYIPLPPIKEQKRIVDKILAVFEKLDCIENNIE